MSVHKPQRNRVFWLIGIALLVVGVLGLFGFLRVRGGRQPEVQLTPLERRVRSANAGARLVSLKAEVLAERPRETLEQQYQVIVDQLDGLDAGAEAGRETWDALWLGLADLDVQLAERDREAVATIDTLLTQLRSVGTAAQPNP